MTPETVRVEARIERDSGAANPREWDNLGTMVCWHRRYTLGDEQPRVPPGDYFAGLDVLVRVPLYLFDHSGLTLSTSAERFRAVDPEGWDWGQVGYIFVTRERLLAEYRDDTSEHRERAVAVLQSEVETYSQYLAGEVYGFLIEEVRTCADCGSEVREHIDSCWGFYGADPHENGMLDHVDGEARRSALLAAYERL